MGGFLDLTTFKNEHQIIDVIHFDSKIHRYAKPHQKSKASWYIGFEHFDKGKTYQTLVVGDYTIGDERFIWKSYQDNEVSFDINKELKAAQERADEEKKKKNAEAAGKADWYIQKASQNFRTNPYFTRKLITSSLGTYQFKPNDGDEYTIVPMRNVEGRVTSLQKIFDDGTKRFLPGGEIKGSFHLIGDTTDMVYVCEGFATGASIHYATGKQVAVCFMASNIEDVALIFKTKGHTVIVCADDDKYHDPTKIPNAGLKAASALYQTEGIKFCYPTFQDESTKPTDFNDLHCLEGLERVKEQVEANDKSICEFLGYDDHGYYFYSERSKMIKCYSITQMKQGALIEMAAEIYWATQYFAKDSGKNADLCDWARTVGQVIEEQQRVGKFRTERVKGLGSWIDKNDHIVHIGDQLLVNFKSIQISNYKGHNFYYPSTPVQVDWFQDKFDFQKIIDASHLIDFRTEADRIAFVGFIAQTPIFTTQRWRSNVWLNAPKGSGKSILLEFIADLAINSMHIQATTAAGIRQDAKYDSKTVLYDEAEGEQGKTKQVLEMARTCSSSGGSKVLRGTPTGKAIVNSNDFLFCFSSIRQPDFTAADESRITTIRLKGQEHVNLVEKIGRSKERERIMGEAGRLGKDLYVYMNKNLEVYNRVRSEVVDALLVMGLSHRQGDQISGLLAGYIVLAQEPIDAVVNAYFESAKNELENEASDSEDLFNAFKDVLVRWKGAEEKPLGVMMYKMAEMQIQANPMMPDIERSAFDELLGYYGIYYRVDSDQFLIKNNLELKRLFALKTNYKDIFRALKTLDCVQYGTGRIGEKTYKCLKIKQNDLF